MVGSLWRGVGLKRRLFRRCSAFMVRKPCIRKRRITTARLSRILLRMPDGGGFCGFKSRPIGGLSRNVCRLARRSAILYSTSLSPCLDYLTDKFWIVSQRRNPSVLIDRSNGLRLRLVNFFTLAVGNIVLTIEKS